jgi:hypothetical protein
MLIDLKFSQKFMKNYVILTIPPLSLFFQSGFWIISKFVILTNYNLHDMSETHAATWWQKLAADIS